MNVDVGVDIGWGEKTTAMLMLALMLLQLMMMMMMQMILVPVRMNVNEASLEQQNLAPQHYSRLGECSPSRPQAGGSPAWPGAESEGCALSFLGTLL